MEVFAGTLGLLRRYAELGKAATEVREIGQAAERGEPEALEVFRGMGSALGTGLAQIQKLLDLDALIFSGGISASLSFIEPSLREALREHAYAPPLGEVPIRVSELGTHAGVIGAACLTS
jgi:glucokinase